MPQQLDIRLLGGLSVTADRPIAFPTRKTGLLLAYLALRAGQDVPRERIKALLWSDRGEQQASGSLRRALVDLRKALGPDIGASVLASSQATVRVRTDGVAVDALRFQQLAGRDPGTIAPDVARIYQGDLLGEISAPDPAFEDWLRIERERLRSIAVHLVERMADHAGDAALGSVSDFANRLLRTDPACEEAHRALIICYHKAGRTNAAIKQYAACVEALRTSFGAEPEGRTRTLLAAVRSASAGTLGDTRPAENGRGPVTATDDLERPSIAVMPFENLSADPAQRFFAEGMAEGVLTELSRIRDFLVIARQSSFALGSLGHGEIAAQLGVRYIISGSVRRAGETIRVTAQLVDATSGVQLWAGKFDRLSEDAFEVQDRLASEVVLAIDPALRVNELRRAARSHPESLTAWEKFHRGMWHIFRFEKQDLELAREFFLDARRCCATYASPYAGLACVNMMLITAGVPDDGRMLREAIEMGETALSIDPTDTFSLTVHANALSMSGEHRSALDHIEEAIDQNPNFAMAHYCRAQVVFRMGRYEDGLASVENAIRRSPRDPQLPSFLCLRACCLYGLGSFPEMREVAQAAVRLRAPEFWSRLLAAVATLNLGEAEAARAALNAVKRDFPSFSREWTAFLTDHTTKEFSRRLSADLARLGVR